MSSQQIKINVPTEYGRVGTFINGLTAGVVDQLREQSRLNSADLSSYTFEFSTNSSLKDTAKALLVLEGRDLSAGTEMEFVPENSLYFNGRYLALDDLILTLG